MVAVDCAAVLFLHPGTHHADVADVVLGAGVRAAGEVDVDRLVEVRLAKVIAEFDRVALGVGGGEFAVGIARAGDEAAGMVGCCRCRPIAGAPC